MPNIWWIALFTFLGGAAAVAIGLIFKQLVIISSHSAIKWDRFLYKYKILAPLTFVIRRIIVTPAFHFAHHGKSQKDGISNPNGNFGNMLSIWDQFFGSASFKEEYPVELGLPNDPKDGWAANYLYPLVKSKKAGSEISKGFERKSTKINDSITVELEPDNYLWCKCGYSQSQPFCDGSHQGSKEKPVFFTVKKTKKLKLCACKQTKTPPYCDNTHLTL